ncbi:MAG: hypothetical protein VCE75_15300 [Alphaproteobacteria bacterium]
MSEKRSPMSGYQSNSARKGPLSGVRVLDSSIFMAGPYASRLLADGAPRSSRWSRPGARVHA